MTDSSADDDRRKRTNRLRADWRQRRSDDRVARDADPQQRNPSDALDSNDRIRAEAPDDLETRRRADAIEREVKRSRGS